MKFVVLMVTLFAFSVAYAADSAVPAATTANNVAPAHKVEVKKNKKKKHTKKSKKGTSSSGATTPSQ